jgi:hypothetical protein
MYPEEAFIGHEKMQQNKSYIWQTVVAICGYK